MTTRTSRINNPHQKNGRYVGPLVVPPFTMPRATPQVAQGEPVKAQTDDDAGKCVPLSGTTDKGFECSSHFVIKGDSMAPDYNEGDIFDFERIEQSDLEIGKDYYVSRPDALMFKRLESINKASLIFRAINNEKYPNKIKVLMNVASLRLYKVVGVWKKVG